MWSKDRGDGLAAGLVDADLDLVGQAVNEVPAEASRPTDRVGGAGAGVIVVRRGHPLTRGSTLTAQRYAAAEHVTVSRRGNLGNTLDDALAQLSLSRRVVASAPTEGAALAFARDSDLVISVPEATTRSAVADLGLVVLPLPLELPSAAIYLSWHQRYDTDSAHAWLRGLARNALAPRRTP